MVWLLMNSFVLIW